MKRIVSLPAIMLLILSAITNNVDAQGTEQDYERAQNLDKTLSGKVYYGNVNPSWVGKTSSFWYENLTPAGKEYIMVNAAKKSRSNAFNTEKLAAGLNKVTGDTIKAKDLPIRIIKFSDDLQTVTFEYKGFNYDCDLKSYVVKKGTETKRPPWADRGGWMWASRNETDNKPVVSPDKKWTAFIREFNLWVRDESSKKEFQLSNDGSNGKYYSSFIEWAPGSDKLMAYKVDPAVKHMISYIESSPADQVQPKYYSYEYAKPGDEVSQFYPQIFDVKAKKHIIVDEAALPNQYSVGNYTWDSLGKSLTFEYNKRGHKVYRVIRINAETGVLNTIIDEQSNTFIDYNDKQYRYDLPKTDEIIWASERDGWNHLYLYDAKTGKVKNQITSGNWVVRGVEWINAEKRQLVFEASGKEPGDPYLIHYYRINFDGTGLTHLTPGDGNHNATFSDDKRFFVDVFSRVDTPPVALLRDADGKEIMPLEKADIKALEATGWKAPEVFTAKGRDGVTDIWGIIVRPTNFDPSKTYPVIEYIYAGPHSSFVPKTFRPFYSYMNPLCELGFIIVQIDGMGTSNRSKAFQDVCYKNLKDAGFPDRILWMKAAAAKYSYMDITRVGIYGTSAGGQNSAGGVLFHPEFYKVAVSSCGCQDNRMDKMWWNELWMGWPVDSSYAECSNTENAWRLQGKLLLINGEMDNNVDPQSTVQLVDALIKAGKDFDYLLVPGMLHSSGGVYGERRRMDYFVTHLLGVTPPDRNKPSKEKK